MGRQNPADTLEVLLPLSPSISPSEPPATRDFCSSRAEPELRNDPEMLKTNRAWST